MNKLGIWAIAIATAFVIGTLSANPVAEAVGGWKAAVADLQDQIDSLPTSEPQIIKRTGQMTVAPGAEQTVEVTCDDSEVLLEHGIRTSFENLIGGGTRGNFIFGEAGNHVPDPIIGFSFTVVNDGGGQEIATGEVSIVCAKP